MTNPDNVDGLPELPEPAAILERTWRGSYFVGKTRSLEPVDITDEHPVFTADQMRAYAELCRAAPAGGDECATCQGHGMIGWTTGQTPEQFDQHEAECPDCSAPAGSGEVDEDIDGLCCSLEFMAKHSDSVGFNSDAECLRTAAALLRKLQQGADYVVVPRVPTPKMVDATFNEDLDEVESESHNERNRRIYAAMIAASQGQEGGK